MNGAKLWVAAAAAGGLILAACGGSAANTTQAAGGPAAQATAAATAPSKVPLILQSDTVLGSANLSKAEAATQTCVRNSRYAHNEEIVWRVRVFDPATGQQMDNSSLDSVVVQLADGTKLNAKYGGHPGTNPTDHFWAVSWTVPASYPTGELDYQIVATAKDGRTGSFLPFLVSPSMIQITADVHPTATGS
jgi:hypothetical protein